MKLAGYEAGTGPRGVVLVHETGRRGLCGWWPYAVRLARTGYHVLLFDLRCYAQSPCPTDRSAAERVTDDVAAATVYLRRAGAARVVLLGASIGGTTVLASSIRPPPGVVGAVDLSGGVDPASSNATLNLPFVYIAAEGDPYADPAGSRRLLLRNRARDTQFLLLPVGSGHGWALLGGNGADAAPEVTRAVEQFLARQLGTR